MATEFTLPNLGENIESGDVIKVLVSVGDQIDKQQSVLELETDKAVVEVPSSVTGVIDKIHVKEGDKARVGQLILTVRDGAQGIAKSKETKEPSRKEAAADDSVEAPAGTREDPVEQDEALVEEEPAENTASDSSRSAAVVRFSQKVPDRESSAGRLIPAAPSVRRFAREIGVDIEQVKGSGLQGRISREDIKAFARSQAEPGRIPSAISGPDTVMPDFSAWGEVRREKFTSVRRITAEHMTRCWLSIPQVTQNDRCDITDLEKRRLSYAPRVDRAGGKLTITAIVLKVLASALRVFPQFNASLDAAAEEVIYKDFINIGIAVDTPRGLLVPVLRHVDTKNILELSVELQELAGKAREGRISPDLLRGGTFTVTNLGGIGGTSFSPIVNWPEVAILGLSRARVEPVFVDGEFVPRNILPLSLTYDHRLIDGADAARFLRWVASALEDPFLIALEG